MTNEDSNNDNTPKNIDVETAKAIVEGLMEARTERDIIAKEMFDNAYETKGADFANYAACLFELGQLNMIASALGTGKVSNEKAIALIAHVRLITGNIESKIFDRVPVSDRVEAGKLVEEIIKRTRKAGG